MNSYRTEESRREQVNGIARYMIGENKRREGFDVTRYYSGGSCRKTFPNVRSLELFLDEESLKFGIVIMPARGSSRKTSAFLERLNNKYNQT